MDAMYKKSDGSITVFLTLSGLLIVAMLGTCLETARLQTCDNFGARVLRTSCNALLSEYSRPLYDNYSMFFIEDAGEPFETSINRYAKESFFDVKKGEFNFFDGIMESVKVENKVYAGDKKGQPLQSEINDYMARKNVKNLFESFKKKQEKLVGEASDKKAKEIEKKVEDDKKLAKMDKKVLKLIEMIDGVSVSKNGVSVEKEFIKMFCLDKKKGSDFGVNEAIVWKKMKQNLDDTPKDFEKMNKSVFYNRVTAVSELINKALSEARSLKSGIDGLGLVKSEYDSHKKYLKNLVNTILRVLPGNKSVLEQTKPILKGKLDESAKSRLKSIWKDYDTSSISFDYTGVGKKGEQDSPMDFFSSAWSGGLLDLVCDKPDKLSKKSIEKSDQFCEFYKEEMEHNEDLSKRVSDISDNENVKLSGLVSDISDYAMDEFCIDSYIQDKFDSYVVKNSKKDWKKSLNYQWEYIVSGEKSDKENLAGVLNRILLIRTVINFTAIYMNSVKKAEALAAATAIVGFTGLAPLIYFTQTLIILVWAMVESMTDIAALLMEKDVPVVKSEKDIKTQFSGLFAITNSAIIKRAKTYANAQKTSFGYKEYLMLFMATTKQSTRLYRIMDLVQMDMKKNGYGSFDFAKCVYSLDVTGDFVYNTKFFRMGIIEKIIGRDLLQHNRTVRLRKGYY